MGLMSSPAWPPPGIDEAGVMYAYLHDWCSDGGAQLAAHEEGGVHVMTLTKASGQELTWAGRTQASAIIGLAHFLIWHDESPIPCSTSCAGPIMYEEWVALIGHMATRVVEQLEQ